MTRSELIERNMDDANMVQLYEAVLNSVKVDFVKMALKEREKHLEKQIRENPAFYVSNGTYKVNWGYYNENDDQTECYQLNGLIYELNALKSAQVKL
jgi:hypothetical protein